MTTHVAHSSKRTTDHETIRRWAEERGGKPSTVIASEEDGKPGILRIDFPDGSGEDTLEEVSWEEFFDKFDEANLAMVYQDEKADGETSYFCKFVARDTAES